MLCGVSNSYQSLSVIYSVLTCPQSQQNAQQQPPCSAYKEFQA